MAGKTGVKALFFDMDGVLVDVSRSYRRAVEETVEEFTGWRPLPNDIQRYKNRGGFNDDWALTHALVADRGVHAPLDLIVDAFQKRYRGNAWDGFIAQEPPLMQTATLDRLGASGRPMGVVTGRPEAEAAWTVRRFGWETYFPWIVAKEQQGARSKPDPFPLECALAILATEGRDVPPGMAAYVGDSVDDMACARSAGVRAIGFIPPYIGNTEEMASLLREQGADVVIDDLNVLPNLVDP